MSRDEKKKVLFVIESEQKLERFMETNINLENMIILQTYQPVVLHPFDDLMRTIIITVYQDNVEEIVVASTNDDQKDNGAVLNQMYKNKELQNKIQTLEYLFKNCMPEFSKGTVSAWLHGGETLTDSVQKTINIIRNHPLLPSHVKVKELHINQANEKLTEIV